MKYTQSGGDIGVPESLEIHARLKYVSGSTTSSLAEPAAIQFGTSASTGNTLYVGPDRLFLLSDCNSRGDFAEVDTTGAMHDYEITVEQSGLISVIYDGAPLLAGAVFSDACNDQGPIISWGDLSAEASGISEWEMIEHNALVGFDCDGDAIRDDCNMASGAFDADYCSCLMGTPLVSPPSIQSVKVGTFDAAALLDWGGLGSGFSYDIAGGTLSGLFSSHDASGSACLAEDVHPSSWTESPVIAPQSGDGLYFLVRAQTMCGAGTFDIPGADIANPPGLVSRWSGESTALDFVGSHNGFVLGGVTFPVGRVGTAFGFDSNDDRVVIGDDSSLNVSLEGFTADLWMRGYKDQPEALATLIEKSHGWTDNTGWALHVENASGRPSFTIGDGSGFPEIVASIDVLDGNLHYLAATWDAGMMFLYVDGVVAGTAANAIPANNDRPVNIGFTWGGGTPRRFFRGLVDEIELFSRALSQAEIQTNFNASNSQKCMLTSRVLQPACTPIPLGLVGWWSGDGSAQDLIGTNHGVVSGSVSFPWAIGGTGFGFDGNDDRVMIGDAPSLNVSPGGFTADLWMRGYKDQPEALAAIVEKSHGWTDNTGWAFHVENASGRPSFTIGDGSGFPEIVASLDVLDGNLHYLAATWDAGTMSLYVDGVLAGTAPNPSPANNSRPMNVSFTWGGGTPRRFFRGVVDELGVFTRALSLSDIQASFDAGRSGKCRPNDASFP